MATGPQKSPGKRRWQFSLRELVMLTIIAALLLTIWRLTDFDTDVATPFFHAFDLETLEREISSEAGARLMSGGSSGGSHGGGRALKEFSYSYGPWAGTGPGLSRTELISALHARTAALLAASDCKVLGRSRTGDGDAKTLVGFGYEYRRGATAGIVRVHSFEKAGESFQVYVLLFECRWK